MLKCDLKLDCSSKTVIIAGVGRIVWRKECCPRITRPTFKQYVYLSEKGNDSCEKQMEKNPNLRGKHNRYMYPVYWKSRLSGE